MNMSAIVQAAYKAGVQSKTFSAILNRRKK